jgi:hypothetical protein
VQAIHDTKATTSLEDQLSAAAALRRLGIRPQEPLPFDGSELEQLEVDDFVEAMEDLFLLEPSLTESHKVIGAVMKFKTDGAAADWVRPYMRLLKAGDPEAPQWLYSWTGFSKMLSTRFGEPDSAETRILKLMEYVVLHSTDTTRDYAMRFFTLAEETGLPEDAKKALYKFGLQPQVRAAVIGRVFEDLPSLVSAAISADNDMALGHQHAQPSRLALDAMPSTTSLRSPDIATSSNTPAPMEIDATKRLYPIQTHQAALAAQSSPLRPGQQHR